MTYVVSDIHGNYDKFKQLLSEIRFSDKDVMYVLGDIVDHGEDPIGLICDISMRYNVLPILGKSDYEALPMLRELDRILSGDAPDPEMMPRMADWLSNGGKTTIEGFKALDADMREGVIEYLEDMALYEEVKVGDKKYVLVHAGIAEFDPMVSLDEYMPEDFISEPIDPETVYFENATIIAGAVPTSEYGAKGAILHGVSSINIDCGAADGEALGCLRLEDGKEFYIR